MNHIVSVLGTPFKIGESVRVVKINDETGNRYFLYKQGHVAYLNYDCGCGQSFPNDPMIGVKFARKTEEFWKDELVSI
jgi:hypothetical protein